MKLNSANLSKFSSKHVSKPNYKKKEIENLIMHIGPGNFHRSHQAYLTDLTNEKADEKWGFYGVSFLSKRNDLSENDHLYSLMMISSEETKVRIVQSVVGFGQVKTQAEEVIAKGASNEVKIISLTITEKGYPQDSMGNLDRENDEVKEDLKNINQPQTGIGLVVAILKKRFETNKDSKVSVFSCDNLQHNGLVTKNLVFQMANIISMDLAGWISSHVSFPSCMVDRITPKAENEDIKRLETEFGIIDRKMVKSETFIQWVIEENFMAGRPKWELAGAIFAKSVENYEKLKLRVLNGGHSALAYYGLYKSCKFIHEAMTDQSVLTFVKEYMEEITPTLPVLDINIENYKNTIVQRFSNPFIRDTLDRIATDGSRKMKEFILPCINDLQSLRLRYNRCVEVIAAWIFFTRENKFPYEDPLKSTLLSLSVNATAKDFLAAGIGKLASDNVELVMKVELLLEMFKKEGIQAIIDKH